MAQPWATRQLPLLRSFKCDYPPGNESHHGKRTIILIKVPENGICDRSQEGKYCGPRKRKTFGIIAERLCYFFWPGRHTRRCFLVKLMLEGTFAVEDIR